MYVETEDTLGHEQYGAVWGSLNQEWLPRRGSRPINIPAIDEFESWPLPWEKRRMRVMIGVDLELGFI